jgi:pimeloyl-ACP methyl ester carboxylesterase
MRNYLFLVFFILLSLGLIGCDSSNNAEVEKSVSWLNLCPDFSKTGKAPVAQNAECGTLDVAENPQNKNSKKIALNVLRIPAVNPVPESDPLFVIAGGPGQSAVVVAESMHSLFRDVRKNRDIVFVDQRGTGKSNPFPCEFDTESTKPMPIAEEEALGREAVKQCIAKIKNYAAYYTTNYAVQDLDAVRAALGYEKINLWGGSYGSRVVLEYLRRYPSHTRASILDGVAPVAIALPWSMEADGLAALQAINKQCANTPACLTHFGDIVQKAQAISSRLLVNPQDIKITHPRTQEKVIVNMAAQDFSGVIRLALYSRDLSSLLPQVISDAEAGDYSVLASLVYLAKSKSEMAGINYGMHYTVVCNEDYPLYKDKPATDANVFLNTQMVQKYSEICERWPRAQLPDDYWAPVKSDSPVLALSGAVDPVTPPYWGEQVKAGLTNLTHIVAPGGHHIVSSEGCIAQLITAFIAEGDGKTLDASCAKNIQPLAIYIPPSFMEKTDSPETNKGKE